MQVVVDKAGEGKAEKPLLDDPVHLLPGIGPETVNKLRDLAGQGRGEGLIPFRSINTGVWFPCCLCSSRHRSERRILAWHLPLS
jgi:hypothetical protein